ncbi:MAG: SPFH domain-containing protein [Deltaproteobacteria bacterium]|nr:SPFH domain-containing protein [Deltaproteobacteria bacterium]
MSEFAEKLKSYLPGGGTGRRGRSAGLLVLIAITTVLFYRACTQYVPPHQFAVKESKYFGGIQEGVYEGGQLYFQGFGVTYHRFPKTWQVLDFNNNEYEKMLEDELEGYNNEGALVIPSSEGFRNSFEMTVIYRIKDPSIVIDKERGVGMGRLYEKHVRTKTAPALKEAFGRLQAQELYDVDKRHPPTIEAKKLLNHELNPVGIEVGEVLVRRFRYIPSYEEKISAKVLQRKLQIANEEQAKAATEAALVRKINAEGQAKVTIEVQRADKERRIILSEAELYQRQKDAEGRLLVEQAEAAGQEMVNKAYEGAGSNRIVGIEMAKKASAIKKVYMTACEDGGINPMDLGSMVQKIAQ